MSIRKNLVLNSFVSIGQKIVRICDQLLLVPFFLDSWGAAYYGEWLTLTIIPSVLAFSDLGVGSAISNSFVLSYVSGDKQKSANIYKSGIMVISLTILLAVILMVGILLGGLSGGIYEKSIIPVQDAMLAVSFLMVAKMLSFYSQMIDGFFRASHKAAMGGFIGVCNSMVNIVVGIVVLVVGYGIVEYAMSQLLVTILFVSVSFVIGRRLISFGESKGYVVKSEIVDIVKKGGGYLFTPIWQCVYFQGTTFAVRIVLGPEVVAVFNTVRTVCRSVNQFFSIINASVFPELQFEYARGNIEVVHRLFRISVIVSVFIGMFGVVLLCICGTPLYNWWIGGQLIVDKTVWVVFMFGAFFNVIWWTSVVTYRVTNRPYHFAMISTIMASVSVLLVYFLSSLYGLAGAAFGTVLFEFVMMIFVVPDSCRLLGMNVGCFFRCFQEDVMVGLSKISFCKRR